MNHQLKQIVYLCWFSFLMLLYIGFSIKWEITLQTMVWLLSCMSADMTIQTVTLWESFRTSVTFMNFFSSMNLKMLLQIGSFWKLFFTFQALMSLLSSMNFETSFQTGFIIKGFRTVCTSLWHNAISYYSISLYVIHFKDRFITYNTKVCNIRNAGLSSVSVNDKVEQTCLNMTIDKRSFSSISSYMIFQKFLILWKTLNKIFHRLILSTCCGH